jgi:hypothetical protein
MLSSEIHYSAALPLFPLYQFNKNLNSSPLMKIIIRMLLKGIEQWLFTTLLAAHKTLCNEASILYTGNNVNKGSMIFTPSFMKPHTNGLLTLLTCVGKSFVSALQGTTDM